MYLDLTTHFRLLNDRRNSFIYWYPRIKDIAPTPKSMWFEVKPEEVFRWTFDKIPSHITHKLRRMAVALNPSKPYPVFLKADTNSGKHDYKNTCYVKDEKSLGENLRNLLEDTSVKDLVVRAIVLREIIPLDWRFKAFWGELPIAPEVRVMIRDGRVERWFFYWPDDAIRNPDREDWQELLAEMRKLAEAEQKAFLNIAERVAERFRRGYWSVDFARTRAGIWYLIDMALGEVSWTPEKTARQSDSSLFDGLAEVVQE